MKRIPELMHISTSRASLAVGRRTSDGFVVYAGSRAASEFSKGSSGTAYDRLRSALIDAKVVVPSEDGQMAFLQDFVFSSPSAAATVVMGLSANGDNWKPMI